MNKLGKGSGNNRVASRNGFVSAMVAGLLAGMCSFSAMSGVTIGAKPLNVSNSVPGNLGIVLSAEAPTLVSVANLGDYVQTREYAGYFDPGKCYKYVYSVTEADRHFYPVSVTSNHGCPNTANSATGRLWSGNFMNWAVTQAIDPFRKEMTGGYRVRDSVTETWLEKAIADRADSASNPPRSTPASGTNATLVGASTPAESWPTFRTRVYNLGNKLWFTVDGQANALIAGYVTNNVPMPNDRSSPVTGVGNSPNVVSYDPAYHGLPNTVTTTTTNATACATSEAGCTTATANTTAACPNSGYRNFRTADRKCHSSNNDSSSSQANSCPAGSTLPTANGTGQVCTTPQYQHTTYGNDKVYEVSVRVAVCVPGLLESNCKAYGGNYKPEGLVQEYSKKLTYSLFSYGNPSNSRQGITDAQVPDGGVMRAAQKFVGPKTRYPDDAGADANGEKDNPRAEWNSATGQFYSNPDSSYLATANTAYYGTNSGLINYINKFGQMNTGRLSRYYDNVSELYYAAFRYFRNLANVDTYSTPYTDEASADAFPVIKWKPRVGITTNDDPYRYQCQQSAILGIGDTNTAVDKALPGSSVAGSNGEGTSPVDPGVDVVTDLRRIFKIEGRTSTAAEATANYSSGGSNKSAFIASLAYHANLRDLRADLVGNQNVSTYWVDIVEFFNYKNQSGVTNTAVGSGTASGNQYWLAAKYGDAGLRGVVSPDYDVNGTAPATPISTWSTTGQYVRDPSGAIIYQRPNNFYTAADAQQMANGLRSAFSKIVDDLSGSGGSFASNSTRLEAGAYTYQAKYASAGWGGQLIASSVNTTTGALTEQWNAATWLAGDPAMPSFAKRKILYANGTVLTPFFTQNTGAISAGTNIPTLSQPAALGVTSDQLLYLLGDRSKERQYGGAFRNRHSMLGDIINSQPVYAGLPNISLHKDDPSYATFVQAQSTRTPVVYVGGNDGMLHAFDAGTTTTKGQEVFAFMPTAAMAVLKQNDPNSNKYPNWSPEYDHAYSMDGELTIADVKIGSGWKTVLVGSMGRGGKSVFAMDVTNPSSPSLLWETTSADIGNVLGKPIIAKTASGWKVFFGNGPNSSVGGSKLISLNVADGTGVAVISAGTGADNGLGPVNIWDADSDGVYETAYAGDMNGDVYKFSLAGTGSATKLFATAGSGQSVTVQPLVARNPYAPSQTWVFFGTGRYLSLADISASANTTVQAWYGLIDSGSTINGKSGLEQIDILSEDAIGRVLEENPALDTGMNGWYMDLKVASGTAKGERMVVPNFFQGLTLIGTTRYPENSDPCAPGGKGFTMAINPFTGGRLGGWFFDNNGDGTVGGTGDSKNGTPYSGITYASGPNNPIFIGDIMYTSMDDGSSKITKTSSSLGLVRRVSWRELLNGG